eukprot:5393056-Amphidinium_carterae.2
MSLNVLLGFAFEAQTHHTSLHAQRTLHVMSTQEVQCLLAGFALPSVLFANEHESWAEEAPKQFLSGGLVTKRLKDKIAAVILAEGTVAAKDATQVLQDILGCKE